MSATHLALSSIVNLTNHSPFCLDCLCREKTTKLGGDVPAVAAVSAWDGKDAAIAVDEIPLDELFNDE